MNFIQKLLYQENEPVSGYEIFVWWERKRLFYNLFYLPFLLLALYIDVEYKSCHAGMGIGLFLIIVLVLNALYFSGWLFELIVRKVIVNFSFKGFAPFLFLSGTLATIAGILFYIFS